MGYVRMNGLGELGYLGYSRDGLGKISFKKIAKKYVAVQKKILKSPIFKAVLVATGAGVVVVGAVSLAQKAAAKAEAAKKAKKLAKTAKEAAAADEQIAAAEAEAAVAEEQAAAEIERTPGLTEKLERQMGGGMSPAIMIAGAGVLLLVVFMAMRKK